MDKDKDPAAYVALAAEKERFRELSDAAFEGIAVHDKGVMIDVNQALAEMFGYTRGEFIGKSALELAAPESRAKVLEMMKSGGQEPYEAFGLRKDGSKFLGQLRGRPMTYQGRNLRVVAVRDISEQKRLEAQVLLTQQVLSMNSLAAGVAHEVNNPLTYVIGNLHILGTGLARLQGRIPLEELRALQEGVSEALDGTERVRAIVADLRRLARPGDEHVPVKLPALVDTALRISSNEIRHRAELVREYQAVPVVEGSEIRLVQVFVNLLLNAAQSIEEGRAARNVIRVQLHTDDQGQAVVEVHDTGAGMAPEVRDRLFEPFFTTKSGGTGLGLSISRSIVQSLGGQISVTSVPGEGSSFRVTLPAMKDVPVTPPPVLAPVVATGLEVLIIDDEATIGQTLARLIGPDHRGTAVTSIGEGLRLIEGGRRFDVILCDLMMPDGTGMELRARLERVAPQLVPRLLFMTGGVFTPAAEEFVARADVSYLEKPLRRDPLMRALATAASR